jgi:hypothetical protein
MQALWIELYERGYIEQEDVKMVQRWLAALLESGYEFPKPVRERHNNVVMMGQFNYPKDPDDVVFWYQKWREVFQYVIVRGAFEEDQLLELRSRGVDAYKGSADRGFYSPIKNLVLTLQQYQNVSDIDGVCYLHDDAFFDFNAMPRLSKEDIVVSIADDIPVLQLSYKDVRTFEDKARLSQFSFSILPDGTFSKADGSVFQGAHLLVPTLFKWRWPSLIDALSVYSRDPRSNKYKEEDGSLLVPPFGQADFLYVPFKHADQFIEIAEPMLEDSVFLEFAVPMIVQILRKVANASVKSLDLCTGWTRTRGLPAMIEECANNPLTNYGMYHPYKLSMGWKSWSDMFDFATYSTKASF